MTRSINGCGRSRLQLSLGRGRAHSLRGTSHHMHSMRQARMGFVALAFGLTSLAIAADRPVPPPPADSTSAGLVNAQRMRADEATGDNWLMYGRTYGEQRFSPLKNIND